MNRPEYLKNYAFQWEVFDIVVGGKSSLDAKNYLISLNEKDQAANFLKGYGFDVSDPVQSAELFGNFQEAIQFIKRYFLKEGNALGLDLNVPNVFYTLSDITELLLIATGHSEMKVNVEDALWAGIILKVMHTILHADKDLRYNYFSIIQTQIFDRYYKFLHRDEQDNLFLKSERSSDIIPLLEFETKAKKTRESIIIKLLHKQQNVAEELFDRIGIRFVTKNVFDTLRVIRFLNDNYIMMTNNIKPSRSQNSLINLNSFKKEYYKLIKKAIKQKIDEENFIQRAHLLASKSLYINETNKENLHTLSEYKAIHFTCRQLIKYRNPFLKQFNEVRKLAKEEENSELANKILSLDTTSIARDIRFFYPYEIQITDIESHKQNTEGEASHTEYKKSQLVSAMKRLFSPLLEFKEMDVKF